MAYPCFRIRKVRVHEAWAAEGRAVKPKMKVVVLEEKLHSLSGAMNMQATRPRCRQSLQKPGPALQLSASQKQGKQHALTLAKPKLILAEWIEKADGLEGKLICYKDVCRRQINAGLDLKEELIEEFKKQNEVQQYRCMDQYHRLFADLAGFTLLNLFPTLLHGVGVHIQWDYFVQGRGGKPKPLTHK
ncbi:LOW QUALITY PROTEIN: hypothetical protein QTO34_013182, partial [Cnephaeus nilssonii]